MRLSDVSKSVVSVEENKSSIEKAKEVLIENNIDNVEVFAQDTVKYLKSVKKKFDITILDPPRKGCTQESLDEVLKHCKTDSSASPQNDEHSCHPEQSLPCQREGDHEVVEGFCAGSQNSKIIYVSCNPATLARDLKYLTSKGCKVESIQPFDMFCHTYHVENVAIIKV